MNRNKETPVVTTPKVNRNRTLFDPGIISRKTSIKHGVLTPFFIREVYPGDTWMVDHTLFIRGDISSKVPLDDVQIDTYYFYVPYRVVYPNFYRVFGEKRNSYDNTAYTIPQVTLADYTDSADQANFTSEFFDMLIYRLNYSQSGVYQQSDTVSALPLAAYYAIVNDYFLDENLDPFIPYEDLYGATQTAGSYAQPVLNSYAKLGLYQANKKFDLFTAGLISPAKSFGANVTIPLGTSAPVVGAGEVHNMGNSLRFAGPSTSAAGVHPLYVASSGLANKEYVQMDVGTNASTDTLVDVIKTNLVADLSNAVAADIQTFRTSLLIYSYYEMRGTIGTRRVEQLKQWGLDVSASELDLPEYLGGETLSLSNIPVLSTQSASLGEMSGVSATMVYNDKNAWSRSFNEMGVIIGLVVSRVKHTYTQGKDNRIWKKVTDLDFYHWIYEALGNVGLDNDYIYNDPSDNKNDETFNFQPAWNPERCDWNTLSGVFSHMAGSAYTDFRSKWTHADYYESRPTFSSSWLKEPLENVARTLTGRLIPNATNSTASTHASQQFMMEFKIHERYARIQRSHAKPANLVGVYW